MTQYRYRLSSLSRLILCTFLLLGVGLPALVDEASAQAKRILFIYNPDRNTGQGTETEDQMYLEILEDQLGYQVQLIGMDQVSTADTAGVDAVFISETVGSGSVVNNFINPLTGGSRFGNIGIPVLDLPAAELYVLELSMYQCADLVDSPRVAALTSLVPEHLDWAGGEEAYYRHKLNLVGHGPRSVVFNAHDARLSAELADRPGEITRAPAKQMRAPGSAMMMSPK